MLTIDYKDVTMDHLSHATQMSTIDHPHWKSMSTVEKVQENDWTTINHSVLYHFVDAAVHKLISLAERFTDGCTRNCIVMCIKSK